MGRARQQSAGAWEPGPHLRYRPSPRPWALAPAKALVTLILRRSAHEQAVSLPYRLRLPFTSPEPESPAEVRGLLWVVPEPTEAMGKAVALESSVEDASEAAYVRETCAERQDPQRRVGVMAATAGGRGGAAAGRL